MEKKSLLTLHREKWVDGCGSGLCDRAGKIVICRGKVPCDVLFVGEAPGDAEDVLGVPFKGPAGQLLDEVIDRALTESGRAKVRIAYTNLVCCIPRDDAGAKSGAPSDKDVRQCRKRLEEFIAIAKPRLIICVGSLARDYFDRGYSHSVKFPKDIDTLYVQHPAFILHANIAQRGFLCQAAVVSLSNKLEELFPE